MLNAFEAEVFDVARRFLASKAEEIGTQLHKALSCEPFLNQLFAKAFEDHHFICVRETPYVDLGDPTQPKASLDIMCVAPDKAHSALIETKLVHDRTKNFYLDRSDSNGHSVAGDIRKLRRIPVQPGRSRFLMVVMASICGEETPADWMEWLAAVPSLQGLRPLGSGTGPLFPLLGTGWFDIRLTKVV